MPKISGNLENRISLQNQNQDSGRTLSARIDCKTNLTCLISGQVLYIYHIISPNCDDSSIKKSH